jgi:hypothetical protein
MKVPGACWAHIGDKWNSDAWIGGGNTSIVNKCGNSFFLRFTVCSELRIKPGIKGGEAESLVSQGFESRKTVIISLVAI